MIRRFQIFFELTGSHLALGNCKCVSSAQIHAVMKFWSAQCTRSSFTTYCPLSPRMTVSLSSYKTLIVDGTFCSQSLEHGSNWCRPSANFLSIQCSNHPRGYPTGLQVYIYWHESQSLTPFEIFLGRAFPHCWRSLQTSPSKIYKFLIGPVHIDGSAASSSLTMFINLVWFTCATAT